MLEEGQRPMSWSNSYYTGLGSETYMVNYYTISSQRTFPEKHFTASLFGT
jgi:hypothetical protein